MPAVYSRIYEIDTTPGGGSRTWVPISAGIDTVKPSFKENVETNQFLSGQGLANTEVYGAVELFAFSGKRNMSDAAQNYIFATALRRAFGTTRHTSFRVTDFDGSTLVWDCTIANIDDQGGKAVEGEAIGFELFCNGQPTFAPAIGTLTVVSVAGSGSAGTTAIYVNPAKGGSNSYKYQTASSVSLPAGGSVLTTGWTAWDGSAAITATTGNQIVVAEVVTATNVVVKAGIATVTAHA